MSNFKWIYLLLALCLVLSLSADEKKNQEKDTEKSTLSLKRRILNDSTPVEPSREKTLKRFSLIPENTSRNVSMRYMTDGDNTLYVASYLHNLDYSFGRYGELDLTFEAGRMGGSNIDNTYFLKPHINYHLKSENFHFSVHIDAPALEKKEGFKNPVGN